MDIHPIMRWTFVAGFLSLVVALPLGCKSSKVTSVSTMHGSTRTIAHVPEERIVDLDPLRWKLDRCERHGLVMTEAVVPLKLGDDHPEELDRDYLVASVELFPHAQDPHLWGDIPPPQAKTHARVRHCEKCIEVKAEWMKLHPNVDECGVLRRTSQ